MTRQEADCATARWLCDSRAMEAVASAAMLVNAMASGESGYVDGG